MKRSVLIAFVWIVLHPPLLMFGQAALAPAPHIGEGGLPRFEKDSTWPKVPAKWKMEIRFRCRNRCGRSRVDPQPPAHSPVRASGHGCAACDRIRQRGQLHPGLGWKERPGLPMAVERARDHRGLQGLRGDYGNADGTRNNPAHLPNDNQILKFTKDGKFVMPSARAARRAARCRGP